MKRQTNTDLDNRTQNPANRKPTRGRCIPPREDRWASGSAYGTTPHATREGCFPFDATTIPAGPNAFVTSLSLARSKRSADSSAMSTCARTRRFTEEAAQVPRRARSTRRLRDALVAPAVIASGRAAAEAASSFGVSRWLGAEP
jgi:hypothetical protein